MSTSVGIQLSGLLGAESLYMSVPDGGFTTNLSHCVFLFTLVLRVNRLLVVRDFAEWCMWVRPRHRSFPLPIKLELANTKFSHVDASVDREARLTHLITHYFGGGEAFVPRFVRSLLLT
jgi:hypothetical protein